MIYLSAILLGVFITVSLIPLMTRLAARFQLVDFPGPRKVHSSPVPRVGGPAIAIGAAVPVLLWTARDDFMTAYLTAAGVLVVFGLMDDIKGLGYKAKFAGQVLAAMVVVFFGGLKIESIGNLFPWVAHLPDWISISLSLIAIVGVTNAINLADGLDGLAGGISLLVFCCIGYFAYLLGDSIVLILSLSFAGAIFGFLRYNTYPATLFMGDTGSQLLGFSAIVLAIKITQGNNLLSPVLPLIILGFPVLDTLTVMVERIREGRSPFSADKNHFHHRLMRFGLPHAESVFTIYVIQAIMIVTAILLKYYSDWVLMTFYAVFTSITISAFIFADRKGFRFKRNPLFDSLIKRRLRKIRDDNWAYRISFAVSTILIPLLLLFSCFASANVPGYVSLISICFAICILGAGIFAKPHAGSCLRVVIYMTVPLVLYLIWQERASWIGTRLFMIYHLLFGISAFIILLAVKHSREAGGFRITTMDFLIIFIALVVPNLPDPSIQSYRIGLLAAEIIVLLFSYEVLITELRGNFNVLATLTLIALISLAIRGRAEI
jgi:UDP-GlcNAc:undecaprenyl-phosphate/decaprenyl-phosphate GlcNAc-1-phosphate transferase